MAKQAKREPLRRKVIFIILAVIIAAAFVVSLGLATKRGGKWFKNWNINSFFGGWGVTSPAAPAAPDVDADGVITEPQAAAYALRVTRAATSECEHVYEVVETVPPTCYDYGYVVQVCTKCGDEIRGENALPLDHNYEFVKFVAPTCSEYGYDLYVCTNCGDEKHEGDHRTDVKYAKTDHVFGHKEYDDNVSCTQSGYEQWICAICGEIYLYADTPALGHTFSVEVERKEYCENWGYVTRKCERCDETETVDLAPLDHDYETTGSLTPTCTADGYHRYTCTRCGGTYDEVLPATGHALTERTVQELTETEPGIYEVYCPNCNEVFNRYTTERPGGGDNVQPSTPADPSDSDQTAKQILPIIFLFILYLCVLGGAEIFCVIQIFRR